MRNRLLGLTLIAWLLAGAATLGCNRRTVEMPDPASTKAFDPIRDKPEKISPGGGKAATGPKPRR